jgi:hypothetical protein
MDKDKGKQKGCEGWGATPALEKLHNLAVWLRYSTDHHDMWMLEVGITLGIDNDTRWSSWFQVIKRANKKRDEIKEFIVKHHKCEPFRFQNCDWDKLERTEKSLSIFNSGTLWVEGHKASLSQILEMMEVILTYLEDQEVVSTIPLVCGVILMPGQAKYSSPNHTSLSMTHEWPILPKWAGLSLTSIICLLMRLQLSLLLSSSIPQSGSPILSKTGLQNGMKRLLLLLRHYGLIDTSFFHYP